MDVLQERIIGLINQEHIPGIAISIIRNGKLTEHHALGFRNTRLKLPVMEDTLFEAASLSKPVFAYAVMRIVERGILDLDRPLSFYLSYQDLVHDKRAELITARMVLSHKSGLVNWRKEGLLNFAFSPGSQFNYSGEGYLYLQKVIEKLMHLSLQDFVTCEVFKPLEMFDSSYRYENFFVKRMATGYDAQGKPQVKKKSQKENCAFTLHTTAGDYAKFLLATLNGFGLEKKSMHLMFSKESSITPNLSWGLGWGLQTSSKKESFFQWGDNGCFKCFAIGYPKEKLGVVFFTNSFNGLLISKPLLDLTIGRKQPALDWLKKTFYL